MRTTAWRELSPSIGSVAFATVAWRTSKPARLPSTSSPQRSSCSTVAILGTPSKKCAAAEARSIRLCCLGSHHRSEEHTSELQSLMRISYAVFCLKKKNTQNNKATHIEHKHKNSK